MVRNMHSNSLGSVLTPPTGSEFMWPGQSLDRGACLGTRLMCRWLLLAPTGGEFCVVLPNLRIIPGKLTEYTLELPIILLLFLE